MKQDITNLDEYLSLDESEKLSLDHEDRRIQSLLLCGLSDNYWFRVMAKNEMKKFRDGNFQDFLFSLAIELSIDGEHLPSRMLAGRILKDSLRYRNKNGQVVLNDQWLVTNLDLRLEIKKCLLETLRSSHPEVVKISSIVIATIASIEKPRCDLFPTLLAILSNRDTAPSLEKAVLRTLSSLSFCEETYHQTIDEKHVDDIFMALVRSMAGVFHSSYINPTHLKFLKILIKFSSVNSIYELESNKIMHYLFVAINSEDREAKGEAIGCFTQIAFKCYEFLCPYMKELVDLMIDFLKKDDQQEACKAVEFWAAFFKCKDYKQELIENVCSTIAPMLLGALLRQDAGHSVELMKGDVEFEVTEHWSLSKWSSACLEQMARSLRDRIVPLVMPFVHKNISNDDWRWREAAMHALCTIVHGPSVDCLLPVAKAVMHLVLNAMKSENMALKLRTAEALCLLFNYLHSPGTGKTIVTPDFVDGIVDALLGCIKAASESTENTELSRRACVSFSTIVQGYVQARLFLSNTFNPHLPKIISCLLQAACTGLDSPLCYQEEVDGALCEILECCKTTTASRIIATEILACLRREILRFPKSDDELAEKLHNQGVICSYVGIMAEEFCKDDSDGEVRSIVKENADEAIELLCLVLDQHHPISFIKAIIASRELACSIGMDPVVLRKMLPLLDYVRIGINNLEDDNSIYRSSVTALAEFCSIDGNKFHEMLIYPRYIDIMNDLLMKLSNTNSTWPINLFLCISYIAAHTRRYFRRHADSFLLKLHEVQEKCYAVVDCDQETMDYVNKVRRLIFRASSSIFLSVDDGSQEEKEMLRFHGQKLMRSVEKFASEINLDPEGIIECRPDLAIRAVKDLANQLGPENCDFMRGEAFLLPFIRQCKQHTNSLLKSEAALAEEVVMKVSEYNSTEKEEMCVL